MKNLRKILSTILLTTSISGLTLSGIGAVKNNQHMINIGYGTALISSAIGGVIIQKNYKTFKKQY